MGSDAARSGPRIASKAKRSPRVVPRNSQSSSPNQPLGHSPGSTENQTLPEAEDSTRRIPSSDGQTTYYDESEARQRLARWIQTVDGSRESLDRQLSILGSEDQDLSERSQRLVGRIRREGRFGFERRKLRNDQVELQRQQTEAERFRRSLEQDKSRLEIEKLELNQYLDALTDAEDDLSDRPPLHTDLARVIEQEFVGRFLKKITSLPLILISPLAKRNFRVSRWKDRDTRDVPGSSAARFTHWRRRFFLFGSKRKTIIVEARSFGRPHRYQQFGSDSQPVSYDELMNIVQPVIRAAEEEGYFHVLGISSGTGWSNGIRSALSSDGVRRLYFSPNLFVILIDSHSGEVLSGPGETELSSYTELFRPEFGWETLDRCLNEIRQRCEIRGETTLEELRTAGFSVELIEQAFGELANEGVGEMRDSFYKGVHFRYLI